MTSPAALAAQRRMTAGLIADDPTTVTLIPQVETTTPSGGQSYVDGTPRIPVDVKMSLLAFDQRPTVTVAGVERVIDYHMIGPWDMPVEVGDYWIDPEGTRWEVVGLTEGWGYETKAFMSRHVGRQDNP